MEGQLMSLRIAGCWHRPSLLNIVCLLLSAGCSAIEAPRKHVVMFRADGVPLDPRREPFHGYPALEDAAFERYLDGVMDGLEQDLLAGDGPYRVLIYIHGGLNTQDSTVRRAAELSETIQADGYYPIFINWESSLVSSYWDHLFWVRQGKNRRDWGWFLAPFVLVTDAVRGVARLPIVTFLRAREFTDRTFKERTSDRSDADEARQKLVQSCLVFVQPESDGAGSNPDGWLKRTGSAAWHVLTLPVKGLGSYLVDTTG